MRRVEEIATGPTVRPTRAEVDLGAIVANARDLAALGAALYAVVKADAYGHGAVPVARALAAEPAVHGLMVSLVEEGLELRHAGVRAPVLVMGGAFGSAHRELLEAGLTPVVSDAADLDAFARAGTRPRVHLKVDTGMSRLGISLAELPALLDRAGGVELVGLATHLACADGDDPAPTLLQLDRFARAADLLRARGLTPELHVANSAGALRFPAARLSAIRAGIALYGGGPAGAPGRPALRLVTAIVQLRSIAAGDAVSYGALYRATRPTRVATLPIGYADGYPRRLSLPGAGAGAEVLVRGQRCPVLGAICMDMTMVDVSALGDDVGLGEEAVLLGAQGAERITMRELADRAGLIEYEIPCGVSKRVPRAFLSTPVEPRR